MPSPPYIDLSSPILTNDRWDTLRALLTFDPKDNAAELRGRLQNVASSYRSRVLQTVAGASRKDDRAIYRDLTSKAEEASRLIRSLNDDDVAALGPWPDLPECPSDGPQNKWLEEMNKVAASIAVRAEAANTPALASLADALLALRQVLVSLDDATYFNPGMLPNQTVIPARRNDQIETFAMQLDSIAATGRQAHSMYQSLRGPLPRTDLMLLAQDLYEAIAEARGIPLKLDVRAEHHNADAKFVRAFADWVHGLIPADIRKAHGRNFLPQAILDAVKEHSERVNKAQSETPRVTG